MRGALGDWVAGKAEMGTGRGSVAAAGDWVAVPAALALQTFIGGEPS